MTKKIFLTYHPGSYGSYLRWVLDYANDQGHRFSTISSDPFLPDGSAHNFNRQDSTHPNGLAEIERCLDEVANEPCGYRIYRTVPVVDRIHNIDDVLSVMFNKLSTQDRCIYVSVNSQHDRDLVFLNTEFKIENTLDALSEQLDPKTSTYGETKFMESPRWMQREILSMWYDKMMLSLTANPTLDYPDLLIIRLEDILKGDPVMLARKMLDHCGLGFRDGVDYVLLHQHKMMLSLQSSIVTLDETYRAVDACLQGLDMPLRYQTLFSESILQCKLRELGKEIRCYDLNEFPSSTADLIRLLD